MLTCVTLGQVKSVAVATLMFGLASAQGQILPLPADAQVERLGDSMVFNGKKVKIEHVSAPLTHAAAAKHYKDVIGGRSTENWHKGDLIIGRQEPDNFTTVRISAKGPQRVEVWIMQTEKGVAARFDAFGLTQPAGSKITTSMESVDGGRRSKVLTYANDLTVTQNREQTTRMLRDRGFSLTSDEVGNAQSSGSTVMWFQKGSSDAFVTITDHGNERQLVINMTEPR